MLMDLWNLAKQIMAKCLSFLGSAQLFGVPILGIIVGFFLLGLLIRSLIFRP